MTRDELVEAGAIAIFDHEVPAHLGEVAWEDEEEWVRTHYRGMAAACLLATVPGIMAGTHAELPIA